MARPSLTLQVLRGAAAAALMTGALSASGALQTLTLGTTILMVHPAPPSAGELAQAMVEGALDAPPGRRIQGAQHGILLRVHDEYTGILDEAQMQQWAQLNQATDLELAQRQAAEEAEAPRREPDPGSKPTPSSRPGAVAPTVRPPAEGAGHPDGSPPPEGGALAEQPSTPDAKGSPSGADQTGEPEEATPLDPAPSPASSAGPSPTAGGPSGSPGRIKVPAGGAPEEAAVIRASGGALPLEVMVSGWAVQATLLQVEPRTGQIPQPVGLIRLPQLETSQVASDFDQALQTLRNQGAQALVIDMQGCPGGQLEQTAQVLGALAGPGRLVARLRSRMGEREVLSAAPAPGVAPLRPLGLPMWAVQDEGTASACEMIAGALQDWKLGQTVGTRTYGKGSTQGTLRLNARQLATISQGQWFTPLGRSAGHRAGPFQIPGVRPGLAPDVEVQGGRGERLRRALVEAARSAADARPPAPAPARG